MSIIENIQNSYGRNDKNHFCDDLLSYVCTEDITEEEINIINNDFRVYDVLDWHHMTQIIQKLANQFEGNISSKLENAILSTYMNDHSVDKDELVFKMIIDPNGYIRMEGRSIWDMLHIDSTPFDLTRYSENEIALFVISMLQDFSNPEKRLKKIMPLFNSNSIIIRRALLYKLIPCMTNYYGIVTKSYKEINVIETEESRLFEQNIKAFDDFLDQRIKCKELSPLYTQNDIYDIAAKEVQKFMTDSFKESEKKNQNSILKFARKVILGRGGGWRKSDGSVQPLGHFRESIPYPMMIDGMSLLEQSEALSKMKLNWSEVKSVCEIL